MEISTFVDINVVGVARNAASVLHQSAYVAPPPGNSVVSEKHFFQANLGFGEKYFPHHIIPLKK